MKIFVEKDYEAMSKKAAEIFIEAIKEKPNIILGLATGSTPIGLYKELIRAHKEEGLDFSKVTTFNLDEYIGLSPDHPSSYEYFMREELFNHINIPRENIHIPDGLAENIEEYCKKYEEMIDKAGGIDIQLLGVGENGHIAFNEPDESLSLGTTIVELTENTIEVNSRFFQSVEEVPRTAISMGIGSILKAKKIVLLANGKRKAPVIKKLLSTDRVSTKFPVSFLLLHPDVTVIVDEEAYNG
ncbi:MAG: glucosamine-6-phosphate deaminase [Tissierellia bacterium]|nr:glucosamine-6-phosphate deaminase [Tissierellia bacterium]